ncbi:MAG: response regulator [Thermodesulfobacteriota bacterium]
MQRILLVDDDTEFRTNLEEVLAEAGYEVAAASNGNEALELLRAESFDVALLDVMMPGIKGTDLLTALRLTRPRMRIIMLTAFATVENAVDAIHRGASDYIAKPFKIPNLLVAIRKALEDARFEESLGQLQLDHAIQSLSNSIRRGIISSLARVPGMRLMELTRELGVDDHTKVVFHLKILRESAVIEQGTDKGYRLTTAGHNLSSILKLLADRFPGS